MWPDAIEHAAADGRCGRTWQCSCGPCNAIRAEIARLKNGSNNSEGKALGLSRELERANRNGLITKQAIGRTQRET